MINELLEKLNQKPIGTVTDAEISRGSFSCGFQCPLAISLQVLFNRVRGVYTIYVSYVAIVINPDTISEVFITPGDKIADWIRNYDKHEDVAEFKYVIKPGKKDYSYVIEMVTE